MDLLGTLSCMALQQNTKLQPSGAKQEAALFASLPEERKRLCLALCSLVAVRVMQKVTLPATTATCLSYTHGGRNAGTISTSMMAQVLRLLYTFGQQAVLQQFVEHVAR